MAESTAPQTGPSPEPPRPKELAPLKQLAQLLLDKGISDAAVDSLQKALPKCSIVR